MVLSRPPFLDVLGSVHLPTQGQSNNNKQFFSFSWSSMLLTWKWTYLVSALKQWKIIIHGFLDISTSDILDLTILITGPPMHWKMFSGIPGLYPPNPWGSHQSAWQPECLQTLPNVLGGKGGTKSPLAENHWLEDTGVVKTCGSVREMHASERRNQGEQTTFNSGKHLLVKSSGPHYRLFLSHRHY